jgi:hypothetical protein
MESQAQLDKRLQRKSANINYRDMNKNGIDKEPESQNVTIMGNPKDQDSK